MMVDEKMTWRSHNEEWGLAAVNYANSIKPLFTKGQGDCALRAGPVPSLVGMPLLLMVVAVRHSPRRRRDVCDELHDSTCRSRTA